MKRKKHNRWGSDENVIKYCKEKGLFGLTFTQIKEKDSAAAGVIQNRHLQDKICKKEMTEWHEMSKREYIEYAKQIGVYKLSPNEAKLTTEGRRLYFAAWKYGYADEIFQPKRRTRIEMTNEEIIKEAKRKGVFGLYAEEAKEKAGLPFYALVRRRGLFDTIFKRERSTFVKVSTARKTIEQNEILQYIASLGVGNSYVAEVAKLLIEEHPDRFPPYEKLVRELPSLIPELGDHVRPFKMGGNGETLEVVEKIYASDISEKSKGVIDDLLYRIAVEEYQPRFNTNPKAVLEDLKKRAAKAKTQGAKGLFKKILGFYKDVSNFRIPGYPSISERI